MASPPPPVSGAEIQTFSITDAEINDADGAVILKVDQFAVNKDNPNDITLTDDGTLEAITSVKIERMGGSEVDTFRFDLSKFNDDFLLDIRNEGPEDRLVLDGVDSVVDLGGGDYTVIYTGSDGNSHTIDVVGFDGILLSYVTETVDGTSGADSMGGGYVDLDGDEIDGADGDKEIIEAGAGADTIDGGAGDDVIDGGDDADTIQLSNGFGSDTITGGEGGTDDDTLDFSGLTAGIDVTYTGDEAGTATDGTDTLNFSEIENLTLTGLDDSVDASAASSGIDIEAGAGDDTVTGGSGTDSISGGIGADSLDGGAGDDTIIGGDGADTITGGAAIEEIPLERVAFQWSGVPDPNDGGQIDDGDVLSTGTQAVGGVNVDFAINSNVTYGIETVYTTGIDAGSGSVATNSTASIDGDTNMSLSFSEPVENVQFNINDMEQSLGQIKITAFDAQGNPITINVTEGQYVVGSDTDGVAGNDSFYGTASNAGDNNNLGTIGVSIPGPVSSIQIDYVANNDSLTMTDVWFDQPGTGIAAVAGGDDSLDGGLGDDVFGASDGTDTIDGGAGSDTYTAQGPSSLSGETITVSVDDVGNGTVAKVIDGTTDTVTSIEHFIAGEDLAENDTITVVENLVTGEVTGFDNTAIGVFTPKDGSGPYAFGGSGEPTINDILNGSFDPGSGLISASGSYTITSGEENGATLGSVSFENFENINFTVVCFADGTRIDTGRGEVPVEDLKVGDLVRTLDSGLQPVRWIGRSTVPPNVLQHQPALRPIRFAPGSIGQNLPKRALNVSPQHRMLLRSRIAARMFGTPEVLVPAKKLLDVPTVAIDENVAEVTYYHLLFDKHEIVFAEGAPAESLLPGPVALSSVGTDALAEIKALFPEFCEPGFRPRSARKIPSGSKTRTLCARHAKNNRPLVEVTL